MRAAEGLECCFTEQLFRNFTDHRVHGVDDVPGGTQARLRHELIRIHRADFQQLGYPVDHLNVRNAERVLKGFITLPEVCRYVNMLTHRSE